MPENFWRLRRDCKATRKLSGRIEVQSWGTTDDGELVCAGVHWVNALSAKWAWRLFHNWQRWRRWYDKLPWNRRENYPAKFSKAVAHWGIHPVETPKAAIWIKV